MCWVAKVVELDLAAQLMIPMYAVASMSRLLEIIGLSLRNRISFVGLFWSYLAHLRPTFNIRQHTTLIEQLNHSLQHVKLSVYSYIYI